MEFMELPYGFRQKYNNYGITVRPEEAEIFKQYLLYHHVDHRYTNLDSIIKRVARSQYPSIFYRDWNGVHYFSSTSTPPRWMSNVRFNTLYVQTADVSDFLELL